MTDTTYAPDGEDSRGAPTLEQYALVQEVDLATLDDDERADLERRHREFVEWRSEAADDPAQPETEDPTAAGEDEDEAHYDLDVPDELAEFLDEALCPSCGGLLAAEVRDSGTVMVWCVDRKPRCRLGASDVRAINGSLPSATSVPIVVRAVIEPDLRSPLESVGPALRALAGADPSAPTLFAAPSSSGSRAYELVAVDPEAGRSRPVNYTQLRVALADSATWVGRDRDGRQVPASPPRELVGAVQTLGDYPVVPRLERVLSAPTFLLDGTLLSRPGYHAESRTYLLPGFEVDVPESPTDAEVRAARELVEGELLVDFPFATQADRANAVGLALLPFVRDMVEGPTPLHFVTAPTEGTGKGFLVASALAPAFGEVASQTWTDSDAEADKRILSELRAGSPVINYDNVRGQGLTCKSLEAALTQTIYGGRQLGRTASIGYPVRVVWAATGNNATLGRDLARRSLPIRLDHGVERPRDLRGPAVGPRAGQPWLHPLPTWAYRNRRPLATALLTLAQAWIAAGRPSAPDSPAFGSYESFAEVVGGVLAHAGVEGFLGNIGRAYDEAEEDSADAWLRPAVQRLADAYPDGATAEELLVDPVFGAIFDPDELPRSVQAMGMKLRDCKDKVSGGLKLRKRKDRSDNRHRWYAAPVD